MFKICIVQNGVGTERRDIKDFDDRIFLCKSVEVADENINNQNNRNNENINSKKTKTIRLNKFNATIAHDHDIKRTNTNKLPKYKNAVYANNYKKKKLTESYSVHDIF
jgi:hypothetical protein